MAQEREIDARLWMRPRTSLGRPLLADTTLRVCTLSPGNWRLYGNSTQVYFVVRWATNATGSLATGESAPVVGDLNAPAVTGTAAKAWGTDGDVMTESGTSNTCGNPLPTDSNLYKELFVAQGQYLNVYLAVASGSATVMLEGPQ